MSNAPSARTDAPPLATSTALGLRRNLKIWQVIGVSIGVMAPSLAINIEPQGAVSAVGRAIPLTYALALVAVLLVSYGFARLAQRYHHSGAVYGMVGATIGPRAGVISAWALTGTYIFFTALTSISVGIFGTSLLVSFGVWSSPPIWAAYLLAIATLASCAYLANIPAKRGTSVVLTLEAITVFLILIAAIVVFVRLASGNAPNHNHLTASVFQPSSGTHFSSLFIGVIFGFLSFAGFEAAAVFGGEAENPRRTIPRAIVGATLIIGVFYVIVATAAMMGFGSSPKGVAGFQSSSSLMGDLGSLFVGHWFGDLITFGTMVSGFSCTLACVVGAARMIYTISRDATEGTSVLSKVSHKHGTPWTAAVAVAGAGLVGVVIGWAVDAAPIEVFDWTATIATLLLLVTYLIVTVAAVKVLFLGGNKSVPKWEIVIPLLAGAILVYTLYKNLHPTGSPLMEPVIALIWLLLAVFAVLFAPRLTTRLGERLAMDDGLSLVVAGGALPLVEQVEHIDRGEQVGVS